MQQNSNKTRLKGILAFILLLITALLLAWFYRPYIYSNQIYDCHFADFFPNLFAVPTTYAFLHIFCQDRQKVKRLLGITVGILVYEFIQLHIGGFDILDILATFIGAFMTYIIISR